MDTCVCEHEGRHGRVWAWWGASASGCSCMCGREGINVCEGVNVCEGGGGTVYMFALKKTMRSHCAPVGFILY